MHYGMNRLFKYDSVKYSHEFDDDDLPVGKNQFIFSFFFSLNLIIFIRMFSKIHQTIPLKTLSII